MRRNCSIVYFIILIIFLFGLWYVDHRCTTIGVWRESRGEGLYAINKDGAIYYSSDPKTYNFKRVK